MNGNSLTVHSFRTTNPHHLRSARATCGSAATLDSDRHPAKTSRSLTAKTIRISRRPISPGVGTGVFCRTHTVKTHPSLRRIEIWVATAALCGTELVEARALRDMTSLLLRASSRFRSRPLGPHFAATRFALVIFAEEYAHRSRQLAS